MLQMAGAIAAEMLDAFLVDYFFMIFYIPVIFFVRAQYRKYSELQSEIYGRAEYSLREITERIILTGLTAGFAASFITVAAGATLETDTVRYLFYVMCLLLLIDLRFVSIPYAAGLLAVISLILGKPDINIPSILFMAAVLQIVESILIFLTRRRDYIPVFIRHNDDIAGAFLIRRFWMIPIVFFTYLTQPGSVMPGIGSEMPISPVLPSPAGAAAALGLDCMIALLCYSDIAISSHPERKSTRTAAALLGYSVVLMILALISRSVGWVGCIGAGFCILGREGIFIFSRTAEKRGRPLYSAVRRGLRVMDVIGRGHAEAMGMMRGDIIMSINNKDIQTENGLSEALRDYPSYIWVNIIRDGAEKMLEYKCYPEGCNSLGIITVPREKEVTYNTAYFERMSIIRNIVSRFRGIDKTV